MLFLPKNVPGEEGVQLLQVTRDVGLMFDLAGGWFGVVDADGSRYDELGAVMLDLTEIDALIVGLGELRKRAETRR